MGRAKRKAVAEASVHKVSVPIYGTAVMLIIGKDERDCEEELQLQWEHNNPMDPTVDELHTGKGYMGRASVVESSAKGAIDMRYIFLNLGLILRNWDGSGDWRANVHVTMAHECIHAAYFILDDMGIKVSAKNHEALTYLVSYLHTECWRCFEETLKEKGWEEFVSEHVKTDNDKTSEK